MICFTLTYDAFVMFMVCGLWICGLWICGCVVFSLFCCSCLYDWDGPLRPISSLCLPFSFFTESFFVNFDHRLAFDHNKTKPSGYEYNIRV
jgi:hypothetical protein